MRRVAQGVTMNLSITSAWVSFVSRLFSRIPNGSTSGNRYHTGLRLEVWSDPWERGCDHTTADLGYSGPNKLTALKKNYYNQDSIDQCRVQMKERAGQDVSTFVVSCIGAEKKGSNLGRRKNQGHCLRMVVVTYISQKLRETKQPSLRVDVFYRTTEIVQKFGADLIFLREVLIPAIIDHNPWGIAQPDKVVFHFPMVFINAFGVMPMYKFLAPETLFASMPQGIRDPFRRGAMKVLVKAFCQEPEDYAYLTGRRNFKRVLQIFNKRSKIQPFFEFARSQGVSTDDVILPELY